MKTHNIHGSVLTCLEKHKGRWSKVSEDTGISKRTIEKIARQEIKDPGVKSVQILFNYFDKRA